MFLLFFLFACDGDELECRDAEQDPSACKCAHPTLDDGQCWDPFLPTEERCTELYGTTEEQREACGQ